MRLAIVSKEIQNSIQVFCNEMEDIIDDYHKEENSEELINIVMRHKGIILSIKHVLLAYQTIFNHACDKDIDYLDFRPDIKKFIESLEQPK